MKELHLPEDFKYLLQCSNVKRGSEAKYEEKNIIHMQGNARTCARFNK